MNKKPKEIEFIGDCKYAFDGINITEFKKGDKLKREDFDNNEKPYFPQDFDKLVDWGTRQHEETEDKEVVPVLKVTKFEEEKSKEKPTPSENKATKPKASK